MAQAPTVFGLVSARTHSLARCACISGNQGHSLALRARISGSQDPLACASCLYFRKRRPTRLRFVLVFPEAKTHSLAPSCLYFRKPRPTRLRFVLVFPEAKTHSLALRAGISGSQDSLACVSCLYFRKRRPARLRVVLVFPEVKTHSLALCVLVFPEAKTHSSCASALVFPEAKTHSLALVLVFPEAKTHSLALRACISGSQDPLACTSCLYFRKLERKWRCPTNFWRSGRPRFFVASPAQRD